LDTHRKFLASANFVRITTTGSTFNPTIELATGSTATVIWTTEGGEVATGVNPTFNFGSAATRHVQMAVLNGSTNALDEVVTFNLGFNNSQDTGRYSIGVTYNKTAQAVSLVENINILTGLKRFAAANTNLAGTLDFTGCSALEFIECYGADVQGVTLTGCTSLIRLCVEQNNLSTLNLNPVAANLYDLRCAAQQGGALTFTPLTSNMAVLYHFCIRDQTITNYPAASRLPVVEELWAWNCGLSGALTTASSATKSVALYSNSFTSADFTDQFPFGRGATLDLHNNQLSSITLTGCRGIYGFNVRTNNFDQADIDGILSTIESFGTWTGVIDVSNNAIPSAAGFASANTLRSRSWTVTTDTGAGVLSDDFERADVTGIANVGNSWYAYNNANANITSGNLIFTTTAGYQAILNPATGSLPANYTVTASIPGATLGTYFGLIGRWNGSEGVRLLFTGNRTTITVGNASNYNSGNVTVPAPSFPASWSNTGIDHTIAMRMTGTTIEIICDGTVVTTCTCATNAASTGTGYGICGEGQNRAWHSIAAST
jgi:hypothetical protein